VRRLRGVRARVCVDFRMKLERGAKLYKGASDKTVCNKA
jgi:hypothetical protein